MEYKVRVNIIYTDGSGKVFYIKAPKKKMIAAIGFKAFWELEP